MVLIGILVWAVLILWLVSVVMPGFWTAFLLNAAIATAAYFLLRFIIVSIVKTIKKCL